MWRRASMTRRTASANSVRAIGGTGTVLEQAPVAGPGPEPDGRHDGRNAVGRDLAHQPVFLAQFHGARNEFLFVEIPGRHASARSGRRQRPDRTPGRARSPTGRRVGLSRPRMVPAVIRAQPGTERSRSLPDVDPRRSFSGKKNSNLRRSLIPSTAAQRSSSIFPTAPGPEHRQGQFEDSPRHEVVHHDVAVVGGSKRLIGFQVVHRAVCRRRSTTLPCSARRSITLRTAAGSSRRSGSVVGRRCSSMKLIEWPRRRPRVLRWSGPHLPPEAARSKRPPLG